MPHVHNDPGQHDLTVSAFIIRTDTPEPTVMMHLHRKYARYLQFGGHVELDETPWQAMLRELREESGYEPDQLQVLQPAGGFTQRFEGAAVHPLPFYFDTHRIPDNHFHSDLVYGMVAAGPPRSAAFEGESTDIRCLTVAELQAVPPELMYEQSRANAIFAIEHLMHDWAAHPVTDWPV